MVDFYMILFFLFFQQQFVVEKIPKTKYVIKISGIFYTNKFLIGCWLLVNKLLVFL